ncbi:MAG TPA: sodium:proton exchanger [Saprospirales bacterium]|nr:sodium:proton exchanger [Saprospirales bacterium]
MPTALTIVFVGCTIFLSHWFATLFARTKIPDVLWLFMIGLILGPVCGFVTPVKFGAVGPVFTTITLIFILFESGIDQRLEPLINSIGGTARITTYNFVATCIVAGSITFYYTDLGLLRSLMLGSIVGGTSSAVVTTLVRQFPMGERTRTVLVLESAFSDVFTLAVPLTLLTAYKIGTVDVAFVTGQMIAAFILAAMLGVAGAFGWSILLNKMRTLQNTVFTTPAFVFVLYGIVELLNYSGPIAALAFGITLGNIDVLGPPIMRNAISRKPISLNDNERAFFSEAVFLLRTFFFVYIGISVRLQDWGWMMLGALITGMLFLVRIPVVRISVSKSTSAKDASYMATIIPKGLGAAVLASLPAQQGVEGGEIIQSIVFSIILCTTVFTTVLTFLVEKTFFSGIYIFLFNLLGLKNGHGPDKGPKPIIDVETEEAETPIPVKPPGKVVRRKKNTKAS